MMNRYYTLYRPPMPGTIPRGAKDVEAFDERQYCPEVDAWAWGWAEYDHQLSQEEVDEYELEPL